MSALAAAPSESLPAIMVLNVKHEEEAGPGIAKILTGLVLQDLYDLKRFRVIGEKDVNQMLNTEQQKQLAGCTDTSCLVELAGAMGTKYTLDGTVGVVGASNVLSLTLIDVTKAAVISRKTAVVKGEREQLLESVHKLIAELMASVTKEPAPAPGPRPPGAGHDNDQQQAVAKTVDKAAPPMNPYKLWGHVGVWGGLGVIGLGGVFTALASSANDDYRAGKEPISNRDAVARDNAMTVTSYVTGAALLVTGVTLWMLSPGDEAWAKQHAVTIRPAVNTDGGTIGLAGSW